MSNFLELSSIKITIFPIHLLQILPRLPHYQDVFRGREIFYTMGRKCNANLAAAGLQRVTPNLCL